MKRREFITLLGGAAAWPIAAHAQHTERPRRIGYLSPGQSLPHIDGLIIEALGRLGWIEGKNLLVEQRYADNDADQLARMANELVRLNVDVIVARGTLGPLAAK